ncbi:sugar phosphate isomerase/epimerase family protein [Lederbergia citrea]|uniref:Sugar phosphate isomerase/epimerase n=1 Tax=Lederbergia citrea TaxID=2833581 RepID=A0A942UJK1_9BACI|nr:sugar phosphate isomerase/epimerase family protein [Lederbergia citrea]MBS4176147.1 sugar phosphate isomerase/epimerase [Lederbergia citrea]MBS4202707.1 sugar phosphate isomerase/epimerase [Lederbergia citrea]MBS4222625.1 sugar phosphate isomerase/epimerase [Lederbergia citrea]
MKFGCCASIDQAQNVQAAGFDFIECTVVSLVPEKNDNEFAEVLKKYQESPVPIGACNVFLPGDMKIVGDTVNHNRIKTYVENALSRVKQIGADTIVFGSGGARTVPHGFSHDRAEEQIIQFLNLTADYAEPLDLTIVIEPLNKKESNIINSVREANDFAEIINRKSIQVLADFYHMDEEKEPLENMVKAQKNLKHIHVADTGRLAPGTGSYPYDHFVECLNRANYNGRVSIECGWNDFSNEIKNAREYLQECFKIPNDTARI